MSGARPQLDVGWIGLGQIGARMAERVLAAGHRLTAYARGAGQQAVADAGGALVPDYPSVGREADVVCVNVFSDDQVREVLLGPAGALGAMRPGSVVAIHTTGSPRLADDLAAAAPPGVGVLDATFSGGPAGASEGSLTIMAGGDAAAFERARPVFATYARSIFLVGGRGAGQKFKLLNNLLFAANIELAVDVIRAAQTLGFTTEGFVEALAASSGGSFALNTLARAPDLDAVLAQMRPYLVKDVRLAMAAAEESGVSLERLATVTRGY